MATIYEVAQAAGVSLATVSRVINDSDKVRAKTREKVLAAMAELDYRPNVFAQSLASNRTNCIGVLVSELHGPIFAPMLSTIEKTLKEAGKFAIITAAHCDAEKEADGIRFLTERKCDALILHIEALPSDYFLEREESLLPFVLLNRLIPSLEHHCLSLDNEEGGYLATKAVLDLGHRQIAYISGPRGWGDAEARLAGHRRALKEFGVPWNQKLFYPGDFTENAGSEGTATMLDAGVPFTAVVCANDEMAVGAMDRLRTRGFGIPDDVSIIGFDNVRWARFLFPKLSTIHYPLEDMSRMAAHWVLRHVYGDEDLTIQRRFAPRLVLRDTTAPWTAP
ncbi:MAG: LacI family DNA-binding transcriptional regulator [Xanthomonadales bacterium]|nr:LacI family DNA-binding transcriptional regulator [Xanthomonadales bacterium]